MAVDSNLLFVVVLFFIPIIILIFKLIPIYFTNRGHKIIAEENKIIREDAAHSKTWYVMGLILISLNIFLKFMGYKSNLFFFIGLILIIIGLVKWVFSRL